MDGNFKMRRGVRDSLPKIKMKRDALTRGIWVGAGIFFAAVGFIGIFLPLLPTTPFLLLAAACCAKGSKRAYSWLLNNRIFGSYIKNYRSGRGISLKAKVYSASLLTLTMGYSIVFVVHGLTGKIILILIFTAVALHLCSIRTLKQETIKNDIEN